SVGVVLDRKPGDAVTRGERLATVHAANPAAGAEAARRIASIARIASAPPARAQRVLGGVRARGFSAAAGPLLAHAGHERVAT
nr:hypothetical protein [Gemmatimonadota bacterium]